MRLLILSLFTGKSHKPKYSGGEGPLAHDHVGPFLSSGWDQRGTVYVPFTGKPLLTSSSELLVAFHECTSGDIRRTNCTIISISISLSLVKREILLGGNHGVFISTFLGSCMCPSRWCDFEWNQEWRNHLHFTRPPSKFSKTVLWSECLCPQKMCILRSSPQEEQGGSISVSSVLAPVVTDHHVHRIPVASQLSPNHVGGDHTRVWMFHQVQACTAHHTTDQ